MTLGVHGPRALPFLPLSPQGMPMFFVNGVNLSVGSLPLPVFRVISHGIVCFPQGQLHLALMAAYSSIPSAAT